MLMIAREILRTILRLQDWEGVNAKYLVQSFSGITSYFMMTVHCKLFPDIYFFFSVWAADPYCQSYDKYDISGHHQH